MTLLIPYLHTHTHTHTHLNHVKGRVVYYQSDANNIFESVCYITKAQK